MSSARFPFPAIGRISFLIAVSTACFSASPLGAANLTFDPSMTTTGSSAGGPWNLTTTDWSTGAANQAWTQTSATVGTNAAIFGGGTDGATDAYAVTLGTNLAATGVTFNNSGYQLTAASAETLTLATATGGTTVNLTLGTGISAAIGNRVTVSLNNGNGNSNAVVNGGGTLNIEAGGTLSKTDFLRGVRLDSTSTGTFNVNGTVSLAASTAVASTTASLVFGFTAGGAVTANVNNGGVVSSVATASGTVTTGLGAGIFVGYDGSATVNMATGSTVTVSNNQRGIVFAGNTTTSATDTFNLNGGVLTTPNILRVAAATNTFNFNGGTLTMNAANTILTNITTNVRDGGANLNTNGFDTVISQPLVQSTVAGDAGTGGLTKSGTGTLTLSSATGNTYTGTTTISGGKLALTNTSNSATGTGPVVLSGGTTATLTGSGISTGMLTVTNGSRLAPAVNTGTTNFGVAGTLTLGVVALTNAALDFDLASTAAGTSDRINTSGTLTLGTVAFAFNELTAGTLDTTNATYALLTGASSVTGFNAATLAANTTFNGGTAYTPIYSVNGGNLLVRFAAIPEPGTWALLSLSGICVWLALRRRLA